MIHRWGGLRDPLVLDKRKFSLTGFGPYRGIAENLTEEGRQMNRRVVVGILKERPETFPQHYEQDRLPNEKN